MEIYYVTHIWNTKYSTDLQYYRKQYQKCIVMFMLDTKSVLLLDDQFTVPKRKFRLHMQT
jgi:hypothetical protein